LKIGRHILIILTALFLILGLPFLRTGYLERKLTGADAVASSSVIIDAPSGEFVVLINKDVHTNAENLQTWEDFFSGKEIGYLFEDIICTVATGDAGGITMAQSFQSRLPENQMEIKTEDTILMLSKAEYGKFDIIIMSKEIADSFTASTLYDRDNVIMIAVKDE